MLLFLIQSFYYVEDAQIVRELTLRNYVRFFTDAAYVPVFLRTCLLAWVWRRSPSLLGYPVAYLLASSRVVANTSLMLVFVIPLMMSYIIKIYAIRAILGGNGFLNRILLCLGVIDQPLTF